jgi:hypothetical protein
MTKAKGRQIFTVGLKLIKSPFRQKNNINEICFTTTLSHQSLSKSEEGKLDSEETYQQNESK